MVLELAPLVKCAWISGPWMTDVRERGSGPTSVTTAKRDVPRDLNPGLGRIDYSPLLNPPPRDIILKLRRPGLSGLVVWEAIDAVDYFSAKNVERDGRRHIQHANRVPAGFSIDMARPFLWLCWACQGLQRIFFTKLNERKCIGASWGTSCVADAERGPN